MINSNSLTLQQLHLGVLFFLFVFLHNTCVQAALSIQIGNTHQHMHVRMHMYMPKVTTKTNMAPVRSCCKLQAKAAKAKAN